MSPDVPVLHEDWTLRCTSPATFLEALVAVSEGQWLMAAPKVNLKLREEFRFTLRYEPENAQVEATGIPYYWRGPFIAARVKAASENDAATAARLLLSLRCRPEPPPPPQPDAPPPSAGGVDDRPLTGFEESVTPVDEPALPPVSVVLAETTKPGTQQGPVPPAAPAPPQKAAVEEPGLQPPEEPADEPGRPHPAPAEERAPAAAQTSHSTVLFGTASPGFESKELLEHFPGRGEGLPIPDGGSLYRLLCVLAANDLSGELELAAPAGTARLFIRQGALLAVEPYDATFDERFARHLVKSRMCEQEPMDQALAFAQAHEKPLAMAIYDKRTMPLDLMGRELRTFREEAFFEVLRSKAEEIKYRFVPRSRFGRKFDPVRLHLIGSLGAFARKHLSTRYAMELEPLLEPFRFKYALMATNEVVPVEVLALNDKEKHAVKNVFIGPNRLHEAYSLCLMTRHGTVRLVLLLHHFRLLHWLDAAVTAKGEETVEEVLSKQVRSMEALDHFQRLEVHWGAHPSKLERALDRLRRKYGPDSPMARQSDEARELCARIVEFAEQSYAFLKDKKQRRTYRLEQQGELRIRRAAEFLVKQAELHRFRGDREMALELVEASLDIIETADSVQKYRSWRSEKKKKQ